MGFLPGVISGYQFNKKNLVTYGVGIVNNNASVQTGINAYLGMSYYGPPEGVTVTWSITAGTGTITSDIHASSIYVTSNTENTLEITCNVSSPSGSGSSVSYVSFFVNIFDWNVNIYLGGSIYAYSADGSFQQNFLDPFRASASQVWLFDGYAGEVLDVSIVTVDPIYTYMYLLDTSLNIIGEVGNYPTNDPTRLIITLPGDQSYYILCCLDGYNYNLDYQLSFN